MVMEIPSYSVNIQPQTSDSGTKIASKNDSVRSFPQSVSGQVSGAALPVSPPSTTEDVGDGSESLDFSRLTEEKKAQLLEQMEAMISSLNKGLAFRVDEESGKNVVTIYSTDTGEIIRQIPDEEMLEVMRRLAQQNGHNGGLLQTKV